MTTTIAVLVPTDGTPPPPESRPIGRAALMLAGQGIDVIFGDTLRAGRFDGMRAIPGGWQAVQDLPIDAIHDRYPSQIRAHVFQQILQEQEGLPMANPLSFTQLCRDKVACQQAMESAGVSMPALETRPEAFASRLQEWGAGFLKPRYGALGQGVQRVEPTDALRPSLPGLVPGRLEPAILQRAIAPPSGWAGRALRVLVQRTADGWHFCPPVVRSSKTDPVANAARGAQVDAGPSVLSEQVLQRVHDSCTEITQALDTVPEAARAVEAGVDLVLDPGNQPHLIEINSRPRGRLEVLAQQCSDQFGQAHIEAVARPLQMLAHWVATNTVPVV